MLFMRIEQCERRSRDIAGLQVNVADRPRADWHTHLVSKVVSNAIHRYELELRHINRACLDVVSVLYRPFQRYRECRGEAMPLITFPYFGSILCDKTTYSNIDLLAYFVSSNLEVDSFGECAAINEQIYHLIGIIYLCEGRSFAAFLPT